MTKHVVRVVGKHGTHVDLAVPGRTPQRAADHAARNPLGRSALAFIVYDRKSATPVYVTSPNPFN